MTLNLRSHLARTLCTAAITGLLAPCLPAAAAPEEAASDKQATLIAVLRSDAPPAEKAITCKHLAIWGGRDAVPALAPLLANPQLASWARIALEVIPDPAASQALRDALPKLDGLLLIGAINSLGVRRDAQAVPALARHLNAGPPEVAAAAAEALGHIGNAPAAQTLDSALDRAPDATRSAVAYGCVIAAEHLLAAGHAPEAVRLYDRVRQAKVPKQRMLEATRGAILARQSEGLPLLLEQLRSPDKAVFGIGLRTARELPGRHVTEALAREMERLSSDWRLLLFLALADRTDDAVLPIVLSVAQSGLKPIRAIALSRLDRFRDPSCLPVLLKTAAEGDPDLTRAAKLTLTRLEGSQVDAELLQRLPQSTGRLRQTLIELAAQRRIQRALPAVAGSLEDPDPGVRRAALETLGVLGTPQHAGDLARFLAQEHHEPDREPAERALVALCGRGGAPCLPAVRPLTRHSDSAVRRTALHLMAAIGGADALAAVTAALADPTETVRDEAVSTLSTWPNNWPDDAGVAAPLLNLARSDTKAAHQIQGARGYLHYVQETKQLANPGKLSLVKDLLPILKRPEEKRLAIATLSTIPIADTLDVLLNLADDRAIAEEAFLALTKVATDKNLQNAPRELRRRALQTVVDRSTHDATKQKAAESLKRIR
ncbi:MAG: HEAT repeat domain-containing protein [Verrucomicrobia bacterium]|nr:HEAT repeat domain-containing protein [Verrucomicrobiota bacterium]